MDLRRYLPNNHSFGISNLTSNYLYTVTIRSGDPFHVTAKQVAEQIKQQKSSLACLKSILMAEFAFHAIPFRILEKQFDRLFKIPVLSYTNLGILDRTRLSFAGLQITDAYMTGAVKQVPYFQIAISTFGGACSISCNLYGTPGDKEEIGRFLSDVHFELSPKP
ncbi:hypothetical protein [Caproiciproducens sp. LBM24188]|nr:hypothetical protein [Oscillospiraceae bacterium]